MQRTALFPGTFDPYTIGHDAIVRRGLSLFDDIIIAIGVNIEKTTLFTLDERVSAIQHLYSDEKRISITTYNTLTMDFARSLDIKFILRGIRNILDFEYEKNMATVHRQWSNIETVFLISEPEFAFISSSLLRDLILLNKDISTLIPHKK